MVLPQVRAKQRHTTLRRSATGSADGRLNKLLSARAAAAARRFACRRVRHVSLPPVPHRSLWCSWALALSLKRSTAPNASTCAAVSPRVLLQGDVASATGRPTLVAPQKLRRPANARHTPQRCAWQTPQSLAATASGLQLLTPQSADEDTAGGDHCGIATGAPCLGAIVAGGAPPPCCRCIPAQRLDVGRCWRRSMSQRLLPLLPLLLPLLKLQLLQVTDSRPSLVRCDWRSLRAALEEHQHLSLRPPCAVPSRRSRGASLALRHAAARAAA